MRLTAITITLIGLLLLFLSGCKADVNGSYSSSSTSTVEDRGGQINENDIDIPYTEFEVGGDTFRVFEYEGHKYIYNYLEEIPVHLASCDNEKHNTISNGLN